MPLPRGSSLLATLSVAFGAAILLWAALYNRYPLTFWDTRVYVEHAFTLLPRPDRLVGYSLFVRAFAGASLWGVVAAQALLVSVLLHRLTSTPTTPRSAARFLALMGLLGATTALPWIAGQLMADVFTSVLILALYLLIDEPLGRWERGALLALVGACVSFHLTHFYLGALLLASAAVYLRARGVPSVWMRVRAPSAALLVGLVAIAGFNLSRSGRLTLASGSGTHVLAHLVDTGIASQLLNEHCPDRGYLLCPHRHRLPMSVDEFLWVDKLDLLPWEHEREMAGEARRLLQDSLVEHPFAHATVAARYTALALVAFRTGEGLDADAAPLIEPQVARYVPGDLTAYRGARQQSNELPVQALRALHTPVAWLSLLAGAAALVFVWRHPRGREREPAARFLGFVYVALVLNALVCGNGAGPFDRYGARVVWLVLPGLWLLAMGSRHASRHARAT